MSGYTGNPDAESEHAMIFADNGVHAIRSLLEDGPVLHTCVECEEPIPELRRQFFLERNQKCSYCVQCQPVVSAPRIKMLDRIL